MGPGLYPGHLFAQANPARSLTAVRSPMPHLSAGSPDTVTHLIHEFLYRLAFLVNPDQGGPLGPVFLPHRAQPITDLIRKGLSEVLPEAIPGTRIGLLRFISQLVHYFEEIFVINFNPDFVTFRTEHLKVALTVSSSGNHQITVVVVSHGVEKQGGGIIHPRKLIPVLVVDCLKRGVVLVTSNVGRVKPRLST